MKHYRQTENYTCDSACLMMAMQHLEKQQKMDKAMEMRIWKEANLRTVPGCLPQGLALSAIRRGFRAEIMCKKEHLCETTSKDKVSIGVAKRQLDECIKYGVKINDKAPDIKDIKKTLSRGGVPLLLVNSSRVHGIKSPHWIVVTKIEKGRVYFHDPLLKHITSLKKKEFEMMHSDIKHFLNKRMLIVTR